MKSILLAFLMFCVFTHIYAQHEHHMPAPGKKISKPVHKAHAEMHDSMPGMQHEHHMPASDNNEHAEMPDSMADMQHSHEAHAMENMRHAFSLHLPMNRNGSGTSWLPDASPMYGVMKHTENWMFMIHGNLFLRYNNQDITNKGSRGDAKVDAPNWLMIMGQHRVGQNGLFHFNTMFSADAIIAGGSGYPLLFQSGETWQGQPLVDRQHPHDLFSELSVSYAHALSSKADVFVYAGYPGEPAIGPVAFMHRPSALTDPDAPLGHHWTDATHITFGVATLGLRYGQFKLEGSSFTGREPDEDRYDFDKPRFDSRSARISFNPSANWALQLSHGFIKSPELLHPEEDIYRTTASAVYSNTVAMDKLLNISAVWGMNKTTRHNAEHAVLLEGNIALKKLALYTRYEWVQKSAEELNITPPFFVHTVFNINAITLGAAYDVFKIAQLNLAAGAQGTLYDADDMLNGLYGANPMAAEIYLRLYPTLMMANK